MSGDLTDDYVAELLKRDAKAKNKEYAFVGLAAFRPSRPASNAPKPNTRFLRNIIRSTDSHNAALKEKEEAEAKARFRALRKDGASAKDRPDRPAKAERKLYEPPSKRRRVETDADIEHLARHTTGDVKRRHRHEAHKRSESDRTRTKATHYNIADEGAIGDLEDRRRTQDPPENQSRRLRDGEGSRHSQSTGQDRREHRRRRSRSPSKERRRDRAHAQSHRKSHRRRRSRSTGGTNSEAESSVGPAPAPPLIKRGRGAHNTSSAMDARFDETYDPSTDVHLESVGGKDDWDDAAEAFRDRAKWNALGAERLRSAGFSEAEVSKWERSGREKGEEDVVWSKKGEGREWDRGKVVDDSGDTSLKASWAS